MLEPLYGQPQQKRFITYDLEWWPGTYELRLIGVYDRTKGYRFYRTLKTFFNCELTTRQMPCRFYAHFGGSSDIIFLLNYILERAPWLSASATFAGSSAVVVRVSKGSKRHWTFVDSGYLIRRPLADIGNWIGQEKGDKNVIYSENFNELKDYNERDCKILYDAIDRLQHEVNYHGGELRATLASCALDLFRRKFLSRTIVTNPDINEYARGAYVASRVEVYKRKCDEGLYYDINSSFPTSMTRPQPGNILGRSSKLPSNSTTYLADVTVTVQEQYLPPLAWRAPDGRVLFPTGTWRSVLDSADIELLESTGGKIDKVHDCTIFEGFSDLAAYVHELYARKESSKGYEREIWKLFLNGLYGKFAERSNKRQIVFRPSCTSCTHTPECPEDDKCIEMLAPEIFSIKVDKDIAHAHVPISGHVTALSRSLLYSSLAKCKDIFYCDTDSVVCGPQDTLPIGPELGNLKLEYSIRDGTFLAPKLYSFAKAEDGKRVVRAKGFSKLDYENFCALAEGRDFTVQRMQRIRESLGADGTVTPRDQVVKKRIYLEQTKRRFLPTGESVPWRISDFAA